MTPPFEQLPFAVKIFLVVTSLLILALGGTTVWRMIRTVFGRPSRDESPGSRAQKR